MTFLVDTNVLSELAKPAPNPGVLGWAQGVTHVHLSTVTLDEVYFGLSWRSSPRVLAWFDGFLARHCRVLAVTAAVARRSGWLRGELKRQGQIRTQADMLIAGTAQVHGLTVVTGNDRDFRGCGIPVLNPFLDPSG